MAYSGSHLAPTGYSWREHWGLVRDESLASQDHAQKVQIWHSFGDGHTNRALSLLDSPIESPYHFSYHQPKTQPATLQLSQFSFFVRHQLSQRAVPYLQGNVHITPLAFDVVGIQCFRIPTFQDAALATSLAIVQAFPSFDDVGLSFFAGGVIYLRRLHHVLPTMYV